MSNENTPSTMKPVAAKAVTLALITGGSRGLGKSMALHLAERGVDVVVTYKNNVSDAKDTVARIEKLGRKATALQLDVGNAASFPAFVETLRAELPRTFGRTDIDALVNNAGSGAYAPFVETSEAVFDEMLNVHLRSTFFLTQRLVPMIAAGGRIVNVSTGLARFSMPGYSAYAAMKGAVEVLTRYLAVELGARGIRVNTVAPGAIATDFGGGAVRDNPGLNAMVASLTPLGRVGEADDVGGAVAALLSQDMQWINGQRVEVAGGMHS
jgi:NAD(P)-dependent dehydrogenase (short-subunit alcohol dehydrogenase family)